ncbi:MAG TPA: DM13 domain-containing protein [Chryseolinea sp.]|nr:DM13 domain-containing protein [Chryseolinea sp.]HPM29045.1 DM13 domain-containing protein [Chryseolinea sp.]
MKFLTSVFLLLVVMACNPEDATPITAPNSPDAALDFADATVVKGGMFVGIGGHTASGTVTLYELSGKKYIVFDPYSSQNGPDLKVYLSKDATATEYIRVGVLMGVMGRQVYEIPGNPDLTQYPFVHIWCEQFSVEFARAALM